VYGAVSFISQIHYFLKIINTSAVIVKSEIKKLTFKKDIGN